MRPAAWTLVPALLASLAGASASAAPKEPSVVAVFPLERCASNPCMEGRDPQLQGGEIVSGGLQIHISAAADLGLEWVRLEAKTPSDTEWYCLEFWVAQRATTFEARRDWLTHRWTDPSEGCDEGICSTCAENSEHRHGEVAVNVEHQIRVLAKEQASSVSGSEPAASKSFKVRLANPGAPPSWIGLKAASGRSVALEWARSHEPDVVEYRFVREDPGGKEVEFAVSSADPSAQGCAAIGSGAIRCVDTSLPAAGGEVSYGLVALRSAPGGAMCAVAAGPCVRSPISQIRSVRVAAAPVVPASPTGAPTDTETPGVVPPTDTPVDAAPQPVAPPDGAGDQINAQSRGEGGSPAAPVLAALLVALVAAGALTAARVVRRAAPQDASGAPGRPGDGPGAPGDGTDPQQDTGPRAPKPGE